MPKIILQCTRAMQIALWQTAKACSMRKTYKQILFILRFLMCTSSFALLHLHSLYAKSLGRVCTRNNLHHARETICTVIMKWHLHSVIMSSCSLHVVRNWLHVQQWEKSWAPAHLWCVAASCSIRSESCSYNIPLACLLILITYTVQSFNLCKQVLPVH